MHLNTVVKLKVYAPPEIRSGTDAARTPYVLRCCTYSDAARTPYVRTLRYTNHAGRNAPRTLQDVTDMHAPMPSSPLACHTQHSSANACSPGQAPRARQVPPFLSAVASRTTPVRAVGAYGTHVHRRPAARCSGPRPQALPPRGEGYALPCCPHTPAGCRHAPIWAHAPGKHAGTHSSRGQQVTVSHRTRLLQKLRTSPSLPPRRPTRGK